MLVTVVQASVVRHLENVKINLFLCNLILNITDIGRECESLEKGKRPKLAEQR